MFTTNNEKPQWQYVLDAMAGHAPGDVITYAAMGEHFPEPFDKDRHRSAILKAREVLLRTECRALVPVANVGYRVVPADGHLSEAHKRRLRAKRQAQKSVRIATHVKRGELTSEQLSKIDTLRARMSDMERRMARQEARAAEVAELVTKSARKQDELAAVTDERITRLERQLADRGMA